MNTRCAFICSAIAIICMSLAGSFSAGAESLSQYVAVCKNKLIFDSIPKFGCKDVQFRTATSVKYLGLDFSQSDDFVAHRQINDSVDAVFACRWVGRNGSSDRAVGGEMIIHNRVTGGTCFFELQDTFENSAYPQVPIDPVSPEDSTAAKVWKAPSNVAACTLCHTAGAYIASPEIVGALARFGLINDGHGVKGGLYNAVGSSGSDLATRLNNEIQHVTQPTCANGCHVVRGDPAVNSVIGAGLIFGAVVMPSINHIIDEVSDKSAMVPSDPFSDYRWINRDVPSFAGDYERLSDVKREFKKLYCDNPAYVQAHVVDDTVVYETGLFVDNIDTFNLQEGLVCMNGDQPGGVCANYETRYWCGGKWRDWQSHDRPNASGDFERRSSYVFPDACKDSPPTRIQARYHIDGFAQVVDGPPDRLYQFDQGGLVCRNEDQPSGELCHNYAVRFICN